MSLRTLATRCLRRPAHATSLASPSPSPLALAPLLSSSRRSFASASADSPSSDASQLLSPAVLFLVRCEGLDPASIRGTGKGGRLLKFDVVQAIRAGTAKKLPRSASSPASASASASASPAPSPPGPKRQEGPRFTASGRRNRSALFEPLPKPQPAPAAPPAAAPATKPDASQPTKPQPVAALTASAVSQPRPTAKGQQVPAPALRRQEGPRFTAGGRRNRSAMFQSPLAG